MHGPASSVLALGFVKRASLSRDGGSRRISYSFPNWSNPRSKPFATKIPVNKVYCLCQSKSNLSFQIQPNFLLLSGPSKIFPLIYHAVISSADFLLVTHPRDSRSLHWPVHMNYAWTHLHLTSWPEWASPSVKVSTSSTRSDLPTRPSSCVATDARIFAITR